MIAIHDIFRRASGLLPVLLRHLARLTIELAIVAFAALFRLLARNWRRLRRLRRGLRLGLRLLRSLAARRTAAVWTTIAAPAMATFAMVILPRHLRLGGNRRHGGRCEQQANHPVGQTTH